MDFSEDSIQYSQGVSVTIADQSSLALLASIHGRVM
jgi:hypothetical protein